MPQPQNASEAAVERLMKDIAHDRKRLTQAMQFAEPQAAPAEDAAVGKLYRVFVAMGQVS